jgi:putative polyhydroxyalkanoate system protein
MAKGRAATRPGLFHTPHISIEAPSALLLPYRLPRIPEAGGNALKIRREHTLGVEEAKRRVDQVAEELGGKLNLTSRWEGDDLRVRGRGVTGRIAVAADSVEVHVKVGLPMLMLREPIRIAIEESIDHYID